MSVGTASLCSLRMCPLDTPPINDERRHAHGLPLAHWTHYLLDQETVCYYQAGCLAYALAAASPTSTGRGISCTRTQYCVSFLRHRSAYRDTHVRQVREQER